MGANLADLVHNAAARSPDQPAIIAGGRRTSWAELDLLVHAVSGGLAARRIGRGGRVVLLLDNSLEFVTSYFGILRAGLVAVPVNTGYTAAEVSEVLRSSGAELVITDRAHVETARQAAAAVAVVETGTKGWRRLTVGSTPPGDFETDPESLAVLLYTSGTSDRPRAAMLTHRALIANLQQLSALDNPAPMLSSDVNLIVLPLFHIYALNAALGMTAYQAATAVLADRFDPHSTLELIRKQRVTNIAGAPPMYVAWSALPEARAALSGVRLLVSGAAPLPAAVFQQFATMGLTVWESYGMTEAAPAITSSLVRGIAKPGSVGSPLPSLSLRLVDTDGEEVGDGDPGEIVIRGPNLFSGYWPDGSAGPGSDGWWSTGDVAIRDEDGDIHLVDRRRELIIVSGFNVYPHEVEAVLETTPGVAEVAVVGVEHPYTGEAVKAWVVAKPGATISPAEIVAFGSHRLARFKCPTIVEVVDSLPHSASGKISKSQLREIDHRHRHLIGTAVDDELGEVETAGSSESGVAQP